MRNVIVICPKTIKGQWEIEIQKHAPGRNIRVMTKEFFRDKWNKNVACNAIIIDEAHCVASTTSKLHKSVKRYLDRHRVPYRWLLTATPVLSKGSMNVFALAQILGHDLPFRKWRDTFQTQKEMYVARGKKITVWEDKTDPVTQRRLINYLQKIGTFVRKEEVYEVPDQTEQLHYIPYTNALRQEIAEAVDGETEPIVIWTKTHRAEQSMKYPLVQNLAKRYKRVMIVSRYLDDIDHYQTIFPDAYVLTGKTKNRTALLQEVASKDEYVFIANSAISEGYELPDTEAIIFSSLDFSIKNYVQMLGRVLRMNRPSPTNIHLLIARDHDSKNSDMNVYQSIKEKKDFNLKMFLKHTNIITS